MHEISGTPALRALCIIGTDSLVGNVTCAFLVSAESGPLNSMATAEEMSLTRFVSTAQELERTFECFHNFDIFTGVVSGWIGACYLFGDCLQ